MKKTVIIVISALAVGFHSGWSTQSWRYGELIAERDKTHALQLAESVQKARIREQELHQKIRDAEDENTKRLQEQITITESARTESQRLRDEIADYNSRVPSDTQCPISQRAVTLGELLGACTEEYIYMADKAQRHVNDIRFLQESWPSTED